jgi:leucyl-tRNA synthetase
VSPNGKFEFAFVEAWKNAMENIQQSSLIFSPSFYLTRSVSRNIRMATQVTDSTAGAPSKFGRRDHLIAIEKKVQEKWAESKAFEVDAPVSSDFNKEDKFLVTFPYPYMNGRLHLGHGFSVSKAEFASRFQRLQGKKSLFPFAFHCTGMPIQAAAGNLKRELEESPEDEVVTPDEEIAIASDLAEQRAVGGVFKGKKTKAKAKSGGLPPSEILRSMGIPDEEIPKFTDPNYWLEYFPPYGVSDLSRFGLGVDWRRSFITTDKNPYYDSFIQWQFRRLKSLGKIKFGNRPTIFSARENQPCADHDRRSGEGVGPQEYTLIKLRVKELPESWTSVVGDQKVFLVAATLRPETMYGQTNCFVLPEGDYGLYQMNNGEVFVSSRRAAINMIYQNLGPKAGVDAETGVASPVELLTVKGSELVGLPLAAPLAEYDTVYAIPMLTISMTKGTGIVTSVPADSPDDYVCLRDWKTRKNWRDQYGVKEEWVIPFEVVPVLEIPDSEFGTASAVHLCENVFTIDSHKNKDKLEEAKKVCYMKGFYSGIMLKGEFKGSSVQEAKKLVKDRLIELGLAANYYEPESVVVSRSGDECVVALCDQWYITYGEAEWLAKVENHLKTNFEMFNPSALQSQIASVEWFKDWACSRTFGLGSRLPWDPTWLIESLSDSTIYMAYYTVAHMLQGDLNGSIPGEFNIAVSDITDADWDYVFAITEEIPAGSKISANHIETMRNSFLFWYPMNLRVSGKDLINNHLAMSLYIHAAIWEHRPDLWPRAFFCNGMVEIDDQKMSKSLGNFLTMTDACDEFGADATRLALADAGDDLTKANFRRKTANDNILALTALENWIVEVVKGETVLRGDELNFTDRAIDNEINRLVADAKTAYTRMGFRDALKCGWFELTNLKEQYRMLTEGSGMHEFVAKKFCTTFAIIMSPITPHFCEHVWSDILGMEGLVVDAKWPEAIVDESLSRKYQTLQANLREFRLDFLKATGAKKGKAVVESPTDAIIFTAESYAPFQRAALEALATVELDAETNEPVDKRFMTALKDHPAIKALPQPDQIKALKFAPFHIANEVKLRGVSALELSLPFNEAEMLSEQTTLIAKQLGLSGTVHVLPASAECTRDTMKPTKRELATPGHASILFYRND